MFLISWRTKAAAQIDEISEKVRARVLGRLDVLSSRVTLNDKIRILSPQDNKQELELTTLQHVQQVVEYDLVWGRRKLCVDKEKRHELQLSDLNQLKPDAKRQQAIAKTSYKLAYDVSGELTNKKHFSSRAYKPG